MSKQLITFTTASEEALTHYPPQPASKVIPDWYKDLPPFLEKLDGYVPHNEIGSAKKCVPVLDYMVSGYVIKNTFQVFLDKKPDPQNIQGFESLCPYTDYIGAQPYQQCPVEIDNEKSHYFKFNQPWHIKTPPGYSCLIYQPHYFFNNDYEILPAIVDTDKHPTNIAFVARLKKQNVVINPGDPLVVIFPFKRESWQMEAKIGDVYPFSRIKLYLLGKWHGTYAKFFHSKKTYS
jgi:hypothetical protein